MKKFLLFMIIGLAGCAPVQSSTRAVSNVVMGPSAMPNLPPLPSAEATGILSGRSIENIMIDVSKPLGTDYGNEDNPLTGIKDKFYELFSNLGYAVYITNGSFANTPENMFDVLASDTALTIRKERSGTVPDAILKVDWREERSRSPLQGVTSLVVPARAELQARASLWGPDGKLVWTGDVSVPIKRSSFVTGGTVRNQFRQPARRAGVAVSDAIFEKIKGFFIFANEK